MTTTEKTYNGWTNYETWNVKLWIDNEEPSYRYWRQTAQECYDEARVTPSANARLTGREPFTQEERATFDLAKRLKDEIEESMPDLGSSIWADLLNAALSEVNWHEMAASMIDDVDKSDDEADDDE